MADGITSLAALSYGTSTGGAAGAGETTNSLGVDRQDSRTPPDLSRVWAAQINQCKNLLLLITADLKGGTRLLSRPQSSNPFGVTESGYYVDNSGNFYGVYNGTRTLLTGGGGGGTGNWTFSGNIADLSGAGAMQLGSTNATSIKFVPSTFNFPSAMSMAATAQGATNTTGLTIAPNVADGASSIGLLVNTTTSLTGGSSRTFSVGNNGTDQFWVAGNGVVNVSNGNMNASAPWNIEVSGVSTLAIYSTLFLPQNDNVVSNGEAALRWSALFTYWHDTKMGAQLTAASTITPTCGLHHVTGATTINIIALSNVPASGNVYLTLIADSTITFGSSASSGGIKVAPGTTLASGKAMTFVLDTSTSLWYPVQGA